MGAAMSEHERDHSQFWDIVDRASASINNWEDWKKQYVIDIYSRSEFTEHSDENAPGSESTLARSESDDFDKR
jgi:hypothetical protein